MPRLDPKRLLVLVNPRAGNARRAPQMASELAAEGGDEVTVIRTHSHEELNGVARDAATAGIARIAIAGGDGTASVVITALDHAFGEAPLPELTLLRGGTMNTVANSLGVRRGKPRALLARSLQAWRTTRQHHASCTTLRVAGRQGFLFGTGIFSSWLNAYYEAGKGHPTPITAASLTLRSALSVVVDGPLAAEVFGAADLDICCDGEQWPAEPFMTVCVGAVEQLGLGFKLFHRAHERADRLHVVAVRGPSLAVARDLPRMRMRGRMDASVCTEQLAQTLRLATRDGSPLQYALDGDLHNHQGPLEVGLGRKLRILLP